jgi:hypothetical protein
MNKKIETRYGLGEIIGYKYFNTAKYILIKLELGPNVYIRWNKLK